MKPVWLAMVALACLCVASQNGVSAQTLDPAAGVSTAPQQRFLAGGFNLIAHTGIWAGEVPGRPEASEFLWGGGDRYAGAGFGVNVDYHLNRHVAAHFDITHYRLSTPVAYAGGYSDGWWIESVSNFTVERVGPFDENVNYWRNATGIRLGVKGYLMRTDMMGVWAGVYHGFYTWEIRLLNDAKTRTFGESRGTVMAPSLLNVGADLWNRTRTLGMTLSFEGGAPLTGGYSIDNCLVNGWNYDDGDGEHLYGPWRMGVSLNFVSPKKN